MNKCLPIIIAMLVAACASPPKEQGVVARNDTIEDYIVAAELEPVDWMRTDGQVEHEVITERYIILQSRRAHHLIDFRRRCRELSEREVTPDLRHGSRRLRARFDTYRGCIIDKMYEVSAGQAKELLDLGEAQ